MSTTIVSMYFNLTNLSDSSPQVRPREFYLEKGRALLSLKNPIVFFCDSESRKEIEALRNELAPGELTEYIEKPLIEYDFYTLNWPIVMKNRESGDYFKDPRNTASYFILCVFKILAVYMAYQKNFFNTSHYAWIDFGVYHIAPTEFEQNAMQMLQNPNPKVSICYIHYRNKELEDMHTYTKSGKCSVAGSVFTIQKEYMKRFYTSIISIFYEQLQKGIGYSDEQIITYSYHRNPELYTLVYGDYYSQLTNYRRIKQDWQSIKKFFIESAINENRMDLAKDAMNAVYTSVKAGLEISTEDVQFIKKHLKPTMTIAVCIPCHAPNLTFLKKCLDSIENQTRKPDIVSISISEVEEKPFIPSYSFPIHLVYTKEKQCEGTNRNIAVSNVSTDIVTHFDADDIMHKHRIEIITKHFEESDIDGFIHNHKQCAASQYRNKEIKHISWEPTTRNLYTDGFTTSKDFICGRVDSKYGGSTNGNFSSKRKVWEDIQYQPNYGPGVDCEYIYNVFNKGYKLGYCPDKLTYYIRDNFALEPEYTIYTSARRPPVYCQYQNSEMGNLIDFLLSDKSPDRSYPVFIIDSVELYENDTSQKIIYNLEQMTREKIRKLSIPRMLKNDVMEVWDYSIGNTSILKNNMKNVRHVPMRLSLDTILKYRNYRKNSEYDVVFCGALSDYRNHILTQIEQRGFTVQRITNNYTNSRDIIIGKARVFLNIHYNEEYKIFETIRCEPWLASGMTVVSESSLDNNTRCIYAPYQELVEKVCSILQSNK